MLHLNCSDVAVALFLLLAQKRFQTVQQSPEGVEENQGPVPLLEFVLRLF